MLGKLEKLKIIAFSNEKYLGPPVGVFLANVNPESYKISHSVVYDPDNSIKSTQGGEQRVARAQSEIISFNFIFDSTGVLGTKIPVPLQVENFLNTTARVIGDIHRPPFIILNWGTLLFKGVLEKADVSYTLFSPSGIPLRASVEASFKQHKTASITELIEKLFSPDLTKEITVKEGDTLFNLCEAEYGDASLYFKVAQANKLINFRKLSPGQKLIFPPLVNKTNA